MHVTLARARGGEGRVGSGAKMGLANLSEKILDTKLVVYIEN
jgi:hypothetical protein